MRNICTLNDKGRHLDNWVFRKQSDADDADSNEWWVGEGYARFVGFRGKGSVGREEEQREKGYHRDRVKHVTKRRGARDSLMADNYEQYSGRNMSWEA